MPPASFGIVQSLPAGEPLVVPENGVVTLAVITGERKQPVSAVDARPMAVRALRAEKLRQAVKQRMDGARAKAEIEYQTGFAPAKPGEAAKGAATPAPAPATK